MQRGSLGIAETGHDNATTQRRTLMISTPGQNLRSFTVEPAGAGAGAGRSSAKILSSFTKVEIPLPKVPERVINTQEQEGQGIRRAQMTKLGCEPHLFPPWITALQAGYKACGLNRNKCVNDYTCLLRSQIGQG